jgi:hypothetical protein
VGDFRETRLWRATLRRRDADDDADARERLRTSFLAFRDAAGLLAGEIARDLPTFTQHDLTHLDALWELSDLIAGSEIDLTPAEAFVLGGAFLIHDLGLGLAAYPDGSRSVRAEPAWSDALVAVLRRRGVETVSADRLAAATEDEVREAEAGILRALHARRAEELAMTKWQVGDKTLHLIDDVLLRDAYGRLIGRVAHSHWWSVGEVGRAFDHSLAPPAGLPSGWTVDPLKLACLLRTSDAAHLDARRAPPLLRSIRRPTGYALSHWQFQEKLHQPRAVGDRVEFTSGAPFPLPEADAWWLCLEHLRVLDRELREVDALLADLGRQRFLVRGVTGVDDPQRLARLIETSGWLPVDAVIRISDVPRLVRQLGGEELYGRNPRVSLRELIQNGLDAVHARRVLEGAPEIGSIAVRLTQAGGEWWLEVEDTGVGMTPHILTTALLDFGSSLWISPTVNEEWPGLLGKGFESVGRFGIGFFAVFMLGDVVTVRSRSYVAARNDTHVLEFREGVSQRPVLRPARDAEVLKEGGTAVAVRLKQAPEQAGGLLAGLRGRSVLSLAEACALVAPAIDVTVIAEHNGRREIAVRPDDWLTIDGTELIRRVTEPGFFPRDEEAIERLGPNVRVLSDASGKPVGRAALAGYEILSPNDSAGAVCVGGLKATTLACIHGVLLGRAIRAARDQAIPLVAPDALADWATEQATVVGALTRTPEALREVAGLVWRLGGTTDDLPLARAAIGWLGYRELVQWLRGRDQVVLLESYVTQMELPKGSILELASDVLDVETTSTIFVQAGGTVYIDWPAAEFGVDDRELVYELQRLGGPVCLAAVEAWDADIGEVVSCAEGRSHAAPPREVMQLDGRAVESSDYVILRRPVPRT